MSIFEISKSNLEDYLTYFNEYSQLRTLINSLPKIGNGYVDSIENPTLILLYTSEFYIFAGNPSHPDIYLFLIKIPKLKTILVPNKNWEAILKKYYKDKLSSYNRTSFDSSTINPDQLKNYLNNKLKGLEIFRVNLEIISLIPKDFLFFLKLSFIDLNEFIDKGLSFYAILDNQIVGLISSFFPIKNNELEIQIDVLPEFRQKGIATCLSSKLILYCLENKIIPHWDADNVISANLAMKLGYKKKFDYLAYYWIE